MSDLPRTIFHKYLSHLNYITTVIIKHKKKVYFNVHSKDFKVLVRNLKDVQKILIGCSSIVHLSSSQS